MASKDRISESVVKTLFALSGNSCYHTGCEQVLTSPHWAKVNADIAHICGEKDGAARFDSAMTREQRRSFDNLMLLCPSHHRRIDDLEPDEYPVERLRSMKEAHESRGERWATDASLASIAILLLSADGVRREPVPTEPAALRSAQLAAVAAESYRERWGADQELVVFQGENNFSYLFDISSSGRHLPDAPENRVVAGWGQSKPNERVGDRQKLRRTPLPKGAEQDLDRGHLIAITSGGGEGVNIVPQARHLNRGFSADGKRWRALENRCARERGLSVFVEVSYEDLSSVPDSFDFHTIAADGSEEREWFSSIESDRI